MKLRRRENTPTIAASVKRMKAKMICLRERNCWLKKPLANPPNVMPRYAKATAWATLTSPWIFKAAANSGEKLTRMPMTNQSGSPMRMQRRYFRKRLHFLNSDKKSPRATCPGVGPQLLEHSRFGHAHAQNQQEQSQSAADEISVAPVNQIGDQSADDRAENADRGDDHRAVAARFLGEDFGNERDAAAEFARKSDTGDETPDGVSLDGMDKAVRDVRHGIKQNGTEKQDHAAQTVAENPENDSADEHSGHLPVQQENALFQNPAGGNAQILQARAAHDAEQNQIVNIHEIAERADDDGGLEDFAHGGFAGFHFGAGFSGAQS